MIEVVTAQSGGSVLRQDGRLLASKVDPELEAREWVEKRGLFLSRVKAVFLLGAGSGHHILALLARTEAEVIVIDRDPERIEATRSLHEFDPSRVRFECVQSTKDLRGAESVRAAVVESFVVLSHPASLTDHGDFFRSCRDQLVGRDWGSLNWQWALKSHGPLNAEPSIDATEKTLTIYDLDQSELVGDSEERERMLFKALRELVK